MYILEELQGTIGYKYLIIVYYFHLIKYNGYMNSSFCVISLKLHPTYDIVKIRQINKYLSLSI